MEGDSKIMAVSDGIRVQQYKKKYSILEVWSKCRFPTDPFEEP